MYANDRSINKLTLFEILLVFLIIVATLFQMSNIVSICFYLSFAVEFLLLYYVLKYNNGKNDISLVLLIIIMLFSLINISVNGIVCQATIISFEYYKKWIMFNSTLVLFYLARYISLSRKQLKLITLLSIVCSCLYGIAFLRFPELTYIFRGVLNYDYITFGFSNPNQTGLFLLALCIICVNGVFIFEKAIFKVLSIASSGICVYFIIFSKARNSLIALLLVVALVIFFIINEKKSISKHVIVFSIVYPMIFSIVYMLLIDNEKVQEIFSFLISSGKGLDSRLNEWDELFKLASSNLIFGAYSTMSNGTGVSQGLNTFVDVLTSYGFVVYILFLCLLYQCIMVVNRDGNRISSIILYGFLGLLFAGAGEAAMFSGGTGFSIFAFELLVTVNSIKRLVLQRRIKLCVPR